jgi:hemoglobin/transferrin/lactoferrin receptor protein
MLNRHHRLALLACTAFVTLAGTTFSYAQSAEESATAEKQGRVTTLKKLTVKAGEKEGVADTPLAERVTEEELDNNQISSFEDLGRSLEPGVNFNRTSGSVNIRGLEGARVLTTIDGIPIPFVDDGARDADGGIDSFDFAALSTIDIVRGADSSRAGGGALGGAVVLRTLEPEDLIGEGRTWGGIFKFAYDGEDDSLGGSAAVAARYDNTAVLFQGGYKRGPRAGKQRRRRRLFHHTDRGGSRRLRPEQSPVQGKAIYRQRPHFRFHCRAVRSPEGHRVPVRPEPLR